MKGVKMPKVLRIEWARVFGQWMGRVVEQSHRGDEFGRNGENRYMSKGIAIISSWCTSWLGHRLVLYVRGAVGSYDSELFGPVTDEDKARIDAAVAAYNKEFGKSETIHNNDNGFYHRVDGPLKLDNEITKAIFNEAADRICPDPLKLNRFNDERIVVDLPAIADAVSGIIARRLRG